MGWSLRMGSNPLTKDSHQQADGNVKRRVAFILMVLWGFHGLDALANQNQPSKTLLEWGTLSHKSPLEKDMMFLSRRPGLRVFTHNMGYRSSLYEGTGYHHSYFPSQPPKHQATYWKFQYEVNWWISCQGTVSWNFSKRLILYQDRLQDTYQDRLHCPVDKRFLQCQ